MHDITSKVPKLATRLSHIATLPWNAFLSLLVSIQFVSSSAGVTSVKFQQRLLVTENQTHRSDQGDLGPIKTHLLDQFFIIRKLWKWKSEDLPKPAPAIPVSRVSNGMADEQIW